MQLVPVNKGGKPFKPSIYQEAIFQQFITFQRDILISAVAGSGKSTTLMLLLGLIPPEMSTLYMAFNVDAAVSLRGKLTEYAADLSAQGRPVPAWQCRTLHSLGNGALFKKGIKNGDPEKGKNKYKKLASSYVLEHMKNIPNDLPGQLADLVDKVRLTLSDPSDENLRALCLRFEIEIPFDSDYIDEADEDKEKKEPIWPVILQAVPTILQQGIDLALSPENQIDYTDMIWLPSSKALNIYPKQFHVVLVDEAQDLSPAQRELAMRACRRGGRRVFCGDRSQSIYGFAGASLRSIDEIIEATGALELPLNFCYRCGSKIIEKARSVGKDYQHITAPEGAHEGKVEYTTSDKINDLIREKVCAKCGHDTFATVVSERGDKLEEVCAACGSSKFSGDLILCRFTAPLVSKCLELLRAGRHATVRGKNIGSQIITVLNQIHKASHVSEDILFKNFPSIAQEYRSHQIELLSRNAEENEMRIQTLTDKIDTVLSLYEAYLNQNPIKNFQFPLRLDMISFVQYVEAFFKEDKEATIILSTGHRAKGLEFPRVFILEADKLPCSKANTADAMIQERNLMYVMFTRAQYTLYLVVAKVPEAPVSTRYESDFEPFWEEEEDEEEQQPQIAAPLVVAAPGPEASIVEASMITEGTIEPAALEEVPTPEPETAPPACAPKGKSTGRPRKNTVHQDITLDREALAEFDALPSEMEYTLSAYIQELMKRDRENGWTVAKEVKARLPKGNTSKKKKEPTLEPDPNGGNGGQPLPFIESADLVEEEEEAGALVVTPVESSAEAEVELIPEPEITERRLFFQCKSVISPYGEPTKTCNYRWGHDYFYNRATRESWRIDPETGERRTPEMDRQPCPKCGRKYVKMLNKGRNIKAKHNEGVKCTHSCKNASSAECECVCGGSCHGENLIVGTKLFQGALKKQTTGQEPLLESSIQIPEGSHKIISILRNAMNQR